MKKTLAILLIFGLVIVSGCATNNTRQGAMVGAGAGTIAAVLMDKSPATSALLILGGALLGGAVGNEMDEQARQASLQNPSKKVIMVEEEPTAKTNCRKVTKKEWKKGKLISETTSEVCTGTRSSNTYE